MVFRIFMLYFQKLHILYVKSLTQTGPRKVCRKLASQGYLRKYKPEIVNCQVKTLTIQNKSTINIK